MMFGSIEHPRSWAKHFIVTRDLQAVTGGFTEFVGLPFVHMASPIYLQHKARRGPTFRETLLIHAVAHCVPRPHRQHPTVMGETRRTRKPATLERAVTTLVEPSWMRTFLEPLAPRMAKE